MCGILGSISKSFQFPAKAVDSLSHRGPDDDGYFSENEVMLGHRRLAIVDLSANGHQPMFSSDGNYVLIFNGEIYNHADIRKKLEAKGYTFRSTSDTETILYGYAEYGYDIVKQMNGIFALAIFDRKKQEVFIARDQFGIKPLYYYHHNGVFAFSSEIKTFTRIPGFDKTIDTKALFYYLQLLYAPGELTPFTNVRKLQGGNYLVYSLAKENFSITPYFSIHFNPDKRDLDESSWKNKLEAALLKAVERQLMSDVPVGYFLSGGLDSSLIVALAKKIMPNQKLKCFTISTGPHMKEEGFADDEKYAKKVAKYLNVDLDIVPADINIMESFDKMIWHLDEPQADPAPLNVYNICSGARTQGIKVLLGGTAGDDLFSGYRRHQAINLEKYFRLMPKPVASMVQAAVRSFGEQNPAMRRIKKVAREINKTKNERLISYFTWLPELQVMHLFNEERQQELENEMLPAAYYQSLVNQLPTETDDLNKLLYLELKTFLPDHNLNYTDKMSMAVGVETRVPYLDLELAELAGRLPVQLKMNGNTTKYLLRKVAEDYLPNDVIYRPKTGFGAPVRQWVRNDMKEMIAERLSVRVLKERGLFDVKSVHSLIDSNAEGKTDASYTIWALLAIESWMEQFVD